MSYFDTTKHGWRLSNLAITELDLKAHVSGQIDHFKDIRLATSFDGTYLYATHETWYDGISYQPGRTYKYLFNSSTNSFSYVSNASVGGNHIVDDGTYLWIVEAGKVYRITKSSMATITITVNAQPLQQGLFKALGYIWAIEYAGTATTNQKLYRIDTSGNVTTFTPTWGLSSLQYGGYYNRSLCECNGLLYSNMKISSSTAASITTYDPTSNTTNNILLTRSTPFNYYSYGEGNISLTTSGTLIYAVVGSIIVTINTSLAGWTDFLNINTNNTGTKPSELVVDSDGTIGIATSGSYLSVSFTYADFLQTNGARVTISQNPSAYDAVGGLGQNEVNFDINTQAKTLSVCRAGQYMVYVIDGIYDLSTNQPGNPTVAILQIPTRHKDINIRPHMLAVGCNFNIEGQY